MYRNVVRFSCHTLIHTFGIVSFLLQFLAADEIRSATIIVVVACVNLVYSELDELFSR